MTEEVGDIAEARYRAFTNRSTFQAELKQYNLYFKDERTNHQLQIHETKGKQVITGLLKLYWGTQRVIRLKKEEPTWKRRSIRLGYEGNGLDDKLMNAMGSGARKRRSLGKAQDVGLAGEIVEEEREGDENGDEDSVEDGDHTGALNGNGVSDGDGRSTPTNENDNKFILAHSLPRDGRNLNHDIIGEVEGLEVDVEHSRGRGGRDNVTGPNGLSASLKKSNLRRRTMSFSGHLYNQKTRVFRPRYGTVSNVRVSSTQSSEDVIRLLLNKFAVENPPHEFSLFSVSSSIGTQELKPYDYPLLKRIRLGPDENVAKIFIMERKTTQVSQEVAQYINLSVPVLKAILRKYEEEEENEIMDIKKRYSVYQATIQKKIDAANESKKIKKRSWWKK